MIENNISNKRLKSLSLLLFWLASLLAIWPNSFSVLTGQSTYTLSHALEIAENNSIYRFQADADNEIAKSRWLFHKANLKPGITLDVLAPNFTKTSREIIQPDGSIAFQSVSQNNSTVSLGIQQKLKSTGGTVF